MAVVIRESCTGKEIYIFINKNKEPQNRSYKEITQLTLLKVKKINWKMFFSPMVLKQLGTAKQKQAKKKKTNHELRETRFELHTLFKNLVSFLD